MKGFVLLDGHYIKGKMLNKIIINALQEFKNNKNLDKASIALIDEYIYEKTIVNTCVDEFYKNIVIKWLDYHYFNSYAISQNDNDLTIGIFVFTPDLDFNGCVYSSFREHFMRTFIYEIECEFLDKDGNDAAYNALFTKEEQLLIEDTLY